MLTTGHDLCHVSSSRIGDCERSHLPEERLGHTQRQGQLSSSHIFVKLQASLAIHRLTWTDCSIKPV